MPFPSVPRVIYHHSPLIQVICQLRFPPILRIDTEIPALLQEDIRGEFPNFTETSEWALEQATQPTEGVVPDLFRQMLQSSGSKNYAFASEDGQWQLNLTRTFISLTTTNYHRWEEFKPKFVGPLAAFTRIYSPSSFTRIGLRYINVICKSALGLQAAEWRQLLQPYILGILHEPSVGSHVKAFESNYNVGLNDGDGTVTIITKFVQPKEGDERCYLIDSDFYTSTKTPVDNTVPKLDYFNTRASRLIRWCITDELHRAMEPEAIT